MLLTIDIGNSNVVIGCLNEKCETIALFRMVTDLKKTEDEYYNFGYMNNGLMILPPMALIIVGIIMWLQKPEEDKK